MLTVGDAPKGVGVAVLVLMAVGNVSVMVAPASGVAVASAVAVGASFGVLTACGTVGKGRGVRVGGGSKLSALCGLKKIKVL